MVDKKNKTEIPKDIAESNNEQQPKSEASDISGASVATDSVSQKKADEVEKAELAKPNTQRKNKSDEKSKKEQKRSSSFKIFSMRNVAIVILLLVIGGGLGVGYGFYELDLRHKKHTEKVVELEILLNRQSSLTAGISSTLSEYQQNNQSSIQTLLEHLRALEQVQASQNKRLLSLSTTSREDWLLAEVEYLLKLANQRVLIEKNAGAADGLLVEADNILRELDDPDLHALRKAVSNDLAKLRLVKKIDFEGIFLELSSIIDVIDDIPAKPALNDVLIPENIDASSSRDTSFFSNIGHAFSQFAASFSQYVKYTDHAEKPTPVLVPELQQYATLNLQMKLEKAQIALLREQQSLYEASLDEAQTWLYKQFPASSERQAITDAIGRLNGLTIVRDLPDITYSLELVRSYLEQLHQLNGVSVEKAE